MNPQGDDSDGDRQNPPRGSLNPPSLFHQCKTTFV